jgi:flagellar basal-body rod modification protein FlgD
MTVAPTSSAGNNAPAANSASGNGDAMNQLSGNFSTFLTLLTAQLKNQDPTSPMDSNAFTQQLVMYSQVEQQIDTNTSLNTLIGQGVSNAALMTNSYLGKNVSVTNGMASLTQGAAGWTYNLASDAVKASMTVTNSAGKVVYTGDADTDVGNHSFAWDGKDNNGNQMNDGTYKLSVSAVDSAGNAVTTAIASAGTVTQIDLTGTTPQLIIGNMEVGLSDIAAVAN